MSELPGYALALLGVTAAAHGAWLVWRYPEYRRAALYLMFGDERDLD